MGPYSPGRGIVGCPSGLGSLAAVLAVRILSIIAAGIDSVLWLGCLGETTDFRMGSVMPLICGSAEFVDIKRRALSALPFARWRNSNIQLPAMCLGVSLLLSLSSLGYLPAVSGRRAILLALGNRLLVFALRTIHWQSLYFGVVDSASLLFVGFFLFSRCNLPLRSCA